MDNIIEALRQLLETTFGTTYTYMYGRVRVPGQQDLPMICIDPIYTVQGNAGTGDDAFVYRFTVELVLIVSLKDYVDTTPDDLEVKQHKKDLVVKMEERDITDRTLTTNSILRAINEDLKFGATSQLKQWVDYMESAEISYNEGAQQSPGSWVVPAVLRMVFVQRTPGCPQ